MIEKYLRNKTIMSIAGIVIGVVLYYVIRRQRNVRSTEKEDISSL